MPVTIGICGGKLYCQTNPHAADNDPCDFLPFDMDEFLRFFAEAYPAMPDRFDLRTRPRTSRYQPAFCARASYSRTDADTATLSESAEPSIGIPTRRYPASYQG